MHAKWDWVDFQAGLLKLPDSKTGKKIIHLSPGALEILQNLTKVEGNPYIIAGARKGQPLISPKRPWNFIKKKATVELLRQDSTYGPLIKNLEQDTGITPDYTALCKHALEQKIINSTEDMPTGIMDVRMHDLRHTYASICVTQGMTIQMVAKLLGHSRTRTSERYAHLAQDPVQQAAAQAGDQITSFIGNKQKTV